ncbi:MAG: hypothetical protein M1134_02775 [Actinobacteria bacterium]|nr:hypothetical protein [Actinomycetota bacterium]
MGSSAIAALLVSLTFGLQAASGLSLSAIIVLIGVALSVCAWSSHIELFDDRIVAKGIMTKKSFMKTDIDQAFLGEPNSGGGFGSSIPIYLGLRNGDRVLITTDIHGSNAFVDQYQSPKAVEFVGQINKWLKQPGAAFPR